MLNFTPALRPWFARIVRANHSCFNRDNQRHTQLRVLRQLLRRAASTEIGCQYGFRAIKDYDSYLRAVPVITYPDCRDRILRMVAGESNVMWPGRCRRFAQSSGTSDGKSKYIPVTDDSLRHNHYYGGAAVVAHYLDLYRDSRLFAGKSFILGGSFANELKGLDAGVYVGDLSANLIDNINPVANLVRVPSKHIALMADWNKKLPALIEASLKEDITNISGVPSWFLTVLRG